MFAIEQSIYNKFQLPFLGLMFTGAAKLKNRRALAETHGA
jgi:hypothetical protein